MRVIQIECPNCGSSIGSMNVKDGIEIKCPYCDSTFWLGESNTYTINKNVNINKTTRNIDDAEILKIQAEREENRRQTRTGFIILIISILMMTCPLIPMGIHEKAGIKRRDEAISEGKLIPGSRSSYLEIDYKAAMKKLKMIGFTNIEHVDLHEGIVFYNDGDVTSITIDGKSDFDKYDGFDPDAQIIITHK